MAHFVLSFMFLITLTIFGFLDKIESRSNARMYLEAQCQTAVYHELCIETLLPYVANNNVLGPEQLARVSLVVYLTKARQTKEYVNMVAKHLNETNHGNDQAIEECMRQIKDGVDQITLSVKEFQKMGETAEENFVLHEGNVQSWVSTALTDADTCVDGLLGDEIGGKEKAIIRAKVLNVKQLASNSLVLFNRFSSRHRASHIVKNP
ncbi:pectinesterase inhibitor 9-like [Rutidosis leptorrhynchoides]|uniref:pectinesterase inhibitor 9-like n=1 Tax=Rutidosis leptorrhynchoides TaxID=125765 RepID=UPI003A99642F